jgi:hypothetical protein
MGRTLPTFNTYLEQEMAQWAPYRRALRKEEKPAFDRLFVLAKRHMAEASFVARPIPFDAVLISILLEQAKAIEALERRMEMVEKPRAATDGGDGPTD